MNRRLQLILVLIPGLALALLTVLLLAPWYVITGHTPMVVILELLRVSISELKENEIL